MPNLWWKYVQEMSKRWKMNSQLLLIHEKQAPNVLQQTDKETQAPRHAEAVVEKAAHHCQVQLGLCVCREGGGCGKGDEES